MAISDDLQPLKPKQVKALAALSAGASDERAAQAAGVSRPTIAKWRHDPAFQSALSDHLRLQRDRIQGILGAIAQDSEAVLRDALAAVDDSGRPAHATRLRAAEASLATYVRISQRAADLGAMPAFGPLIMLPPGTQRMALALDDGSGSRADSAPTANSASSGATTAPAVDAQILRAEPAAGLAHGQERTQSPTLAPARQLSAGPIALTAEDPEPDDDSNHNP